MAPAGVCRSPSWVEATARMIGERPFQDGATTRGAGRSVVSPVMTALIARTGWAATPLGPVESWPIEVRSLLEVMLASRFPMVFWWGPHLIQFYNDAYLPIIGQKHPVALGQTAAQCWSEIWDAVGPQLTSIQAGGPATWNEDVCLDINRHGFIGESYFTWSYSPMPYAEAPNGVGGVFCAVQETTAKVIGERRVRLLRDLAARAIETTTAEDECRVAVETLARYERSVPFSLIYLLDESRTTARLAASSGLEGTDVALAPRSVDLTRENGDPWPLGEALRREQLVLIDDLDVRLTHVPPGPWPEPPRQAVVVPILSGIAHEPAGLLVAGVNPREPFDEGYRSFYELIAGQIAAAISSARAYENERKRAEALAELDRAKIEFFSNVSHEFRTPLTLMLGPLAELLRDADPHAAPLLDTAHRNALRLLKLVNNLLEFARLEAGRDEATFVETDLAAVTRDLCSLFRSAVESAGLRFVVDVALSQPVFVDRSMWEMIVLNLLSNALKFTHEGEIRLTLRERDGVAEVAVADTGIGIPEADLQHIFERFRRVRGAKARSHEGSGIGLALVDELARLHGGSISVHSELGRGSTFVVSIPLGRGHLDPARIAQNTRTASAGSVIEQYLADVDATIVRAAAVAAPRADGAKAARVLLADDNGDLRAYVSRILAPRHDVVAVGNGADALRVLREQRFDLVISDVMMPEMDGFALIQAIRHDPSLETLPVIMLSARAGENSSVEGLNRGADDYLVKPFSSEELLARVHAQLTAASIRARATRELRVSEERFRMLAASMPHIVLEGDLANGVTYLSDAFGAYTGLPDASGYGSGWLAAVHPDDVTETTERWELALRAGGTFAREFRLRRADGAYRWHAGRALPQRDLADGVVRWTGTITDVHDMRRSAHERAFLAEASRVLAQSLDLNETLQSIAQIVVARFSAWCQITLRTPEGLRTLAIAHQDPAKHRLAQRFVGRTHFNASAPRGTPYTARTGRSDLVENGRAVAEEVVNDPAEFAIYEQLGFAWSICVPLVAEGQTLGTIAAVYDEAARKDGRDDLSVLEELGRRAGVAVRRASDFEREHRVAQSFQNASLPSALPLLSRASFDAVYVPASDEAQVGGDWYDAVRLADGRVVISIGDVAGNGLAAAVTMGNMRQIIRGIAQVHADPALMLDAADRALRLEHPDRFVTAFVGVFDPIARTFAYASAGHPPPMLRHPDGEIELLSDGGLPLGLRHIAKQQGKMIGVRPGSYFVFYTDGLTEATRRPADGEEQLRAILREGTALAAPHPAQALRDAMFAATSPTDDVAILVLGIAESAGSPSDDDLVERWRFDVADAQAGQSARGSFAQGMRARQGDPECIHNAEVVFGELLGNAARYAPGTVEVTVDWSGTAPVLHVLDEGPGFHHVPALPGDVYSESGRGLFLIASLSQDFSVSKRPEGGSHARAVLGLYRRPFQQMTGTRVPAP
jgi:PAS domain S-box-containing protein